MTAAPCDRDGAFEPKIVKKRQKRLSSVDEMVISLATKGLITNSPEEELHLRRWVVRASPGVG